MLLGKKNLLLQNTTPHAANTRGSYYHSLHFVDEETEAQEASCPKSRSQEAAKQAPQSFPNQLCYSAS